MTLTGVCKGLSIIAFLAGLRFQVIFRSIYAGYDEYSLLYSTRDFFPLLVPYSEILLLGRVASNGNESIKVSKLDVNNTPVIFSFIIWILFGFGRLLLMYLWKRAEGAGGHFRSEKKLEIFVI